MSVLGFNLNPLQEQPVFLTGDISPVFHEYFSVFMLILEPDGATRCVLCRIFQSIDLATSLETLSSCGHLFVVPKTKLLKWVY